MPEKGFAVCRDAQFGEFNVSLETSLGPVSFVPSEGQEWYVERVSGVWHFERRTGFQNEALQRLKSSSPGDVIIEAEGSLLLYDKDGQLPSLPKIQEMIDAGSNDVNSTKLQAPSIYGATSTLSINEVGSPSADVSLKFQIPANGSFFELWVSLDNVTYTIGGNSSASPGIIKGLEPGTKYYFKVRAESDGGSVSPLSEPFEYTTIGFQDSVPVPSLPKVTAGAGLLEVVWDGRDSDGNLAPKNVVGVNVSVQTLVDRTVANGYASATSLFHYPNAVGGELYFVRLQSRSFRGSVSQWTAPVSVTAISSVDVEQLRDQINDKITEASREINRNRESLSSLQTTAARLQDIADLAEQEYQSAAASLTNRQSNSNFENRLAEGWTTLNPDGLSTWETSPGSGDFYVRLIPPAEFVGTTVTAKPGETWEVSFRYQTKDLTGALVGGPLLDYQSNDGVWHPFTQPLLSASQSKWTQGRFSGVVPAGGVAVRIRAYASTGTYLLDDLQLKNTTALLELEKAAREARAVALLAQESASRAPVSVEVPLHVDRTPNEPFSIEEGFRARGDVWLDTDSLEPAYEWDLGLWRSTTNADLRPSLEFLLLNQSESRIYAWDYQPALAKPGDVWIDVGQGNRPNRWDGDSWEEIVDQSKKPLESQLALLTSKLPIEQSGTFRAFYQSTAPSSPASRDVWVNGSTVRIYTNGTWTVDSSLSLFTSTDVAPGSKTDGLVRVFAQTTQPGDVGAKDSGDLWLSGTTVKKWDGASWTATAINASTWPTALRPYTQNLRTGYVTIAYTPDPPASGNFWFNTSLRVLSERANNSWSAIQNADLVEAVSRAGTKQSIQDNLVTIYSQDREPTSPSGLGDFWVDTLNGERILIWDGLQWGVSGNVYLSRLTSSVETVLSHMRGIVSPDLESTMRYVARSAGGNSTIYTASTPPNITGKEVGDLWWQVATEGSGSTQTQTIIGQWVWSGDSTGWAKQKLRHEIISSVDVGSLVVGGQANIAQAVIDKLYADVVESRVIATKLLTVADFTNLHPDPFFENYAVEYNLDSDWARVDRTLVHTATQSRTFYLFQKNWTRVLPGRSYTVGATITLPTGKAGFTNTSVRLEVKGRDGSTSTYPIDGPLAEGRASYSTQYSVPSDGSVVAVRLNYTATSSVDGVTVFSEPFIRLMNAGELVVDGTILTRHLAAEAVTVDKLAANAVTADKILAGAVRAKHLAVDSTDPTTMNRIVIDAQGIKLYGLNDQLVTEITNVGTNLYRVLDSDGGTLAAVSTDGTIAGEEVYANTQVYIAGRPLDGPQGLITERPGGVLPGSIGWRDLSGLNRSDAVEWGFMEIAGEIYPDRVYQLNVEPFMMVSPGPTTKYLRLRYSTDESVRPDLTSKVHNSWGFRDTSTYGLVTLGGSFWLRGSTILGSASADPQTVRFLLCVTAEEGISFPRGVSEVTAWITDLGDDTGLEPAGRHRDLYIKKDSTTNTVGDAVAPAPTYKTATLSVSSFKNYKGSGAEYYWPPNTNSNLFQGGTNWAGLGTLRSVALFSGASILTGKRIIRSKVRFTAKGTYQTAGSMLQVVGHTLSSIPGTKPSIIPFGTIKVRPGQTIEYTIPSSFYSRITSGEIKGIGLGDGNADYNQYVWGPASSLKWITTYTT